MMKRQVWLLSLLMLLAACAPLTEAPTAIPTTTLLPTPASAEEAALINLHPLTTSGLAWFGDWAPDGESLVYVDAGDHLIAWACLAPQRWARQGLAYFMAERQCVHRAHVVDIRSMYTEMEAGAERQMFQVKVDLGMTRDCFSGLAPGPFTVLVQETPDGPWLIDSFNTGP